MVFLGVSLRPLQVHCAPGEPLLPRLGVPLPLSRPLLPTEVLSFQTWSASCFEAGVIFFLSISEDTRAQPGTAGHCRCPES